MLNFLRKKKSAPNMRDYLPSVGAKPILTLTSSLSRPLRIIASYILAPSHPQSVDEDEVVY